MLSRPMIVVIVLFLIYKAAIIWTSHSRLVIKTYDVGQGDAIMIVTEGKKRILIDGGPDLEVDRYVDKEFWLNECHLEMMILTHPHQDHMKGLNRLLERCKVDVVIHREVDYDSHGYDDWLDKISNMQTINAKAGDKYTIDGITLLVVWPPAEQEFQENINNSSVSVLLDYGKFEALFLGDLETEASTLLMDSYWDEYVQGRLDVYKTPHHGSMDSFNPELISLLRPLTCVVSVGENKYGHPSSEVMSFMEKQGCQIQRTDDMGTIELFIN